MGIYGNTGDNPFEVITTLMMQIGSAFIYIVLSFMVICIGIFFILKIKLLSRQLKEDKINNVTLQKTDEESPE